MPGDIYKKLIFLSNIQKIFPKISNVQRKKQKHHKTQSYSLWKNLPRLETRRVNMILDLLWKLMNNLSWITNKQLQILQTEIRKMLRILHDCHYFIIRFKIKIDHIDSMHTLTRKKLLWL